MSCMKSPAKLRATLAFLAKTGKPSGDVGPLTWIGANDHRKTRLLRSNAIIFACQLALATAAFTCAAVYNGFPLVDPDTSTHIASAASGNLYWLRSPLYSYFVLILDGGGHSLWPVVIGQGLIGAVLIHLTMRVLLGLRTLRRWYLGVALALAVFTSLPWETGEIMPDVFAAYAILGVFLLGFGAAKLSKLETGLVLLLTLLATAVHYSHLPLVLALGLTTIIVIVARGGWKALRPALLVRLGAPALFVFVGLVLLQGLTTGHWGFASAAHVSPLARLVAEGPAVSYLRKECPTQHFALCDHLNELPMPDLVFMFDSNGIVERSGGAMAMSSEADAIVRGTILRYPLWTFEIVLSNTWKQLWHFGTGAFLFPLLESAPEPSKNGTPNSIKQFVPSDYPAYTQSRQATGQLHRLNRVHRVVAWASIAGFPLMFLIFARRGDRLMLRFMLIIGTGMLANALICAGLAIVIDRYQARVIWLVVFAVLAGTLRFLTVRTSEKTRNSGAVLPSGSPETS
jgi:hypothetical protein